MSVLAEPPLLAALQSLEQGGLKGKPRGDAFEELVARVFRRAHFRVAPNAGTARPRQTDLLAIGYREAYLVEAKCTSKPSTITDLDSLRARLGRVQKGVVGVLIAHQGFSSTVVADVEARRDQPVLLIDGDEFRGLCSGNADLRSLLRLKHDTLLLHGRVSGAARIVPLPTRSPLDWPPIDGTWFRGGDSDSNWVAGAGGFGRYTFSRELSDPDWVPGSGFGVTMHVPISAITLDGVEHVLRELVLLGWASGDGHWRIGQAETNWHGIGARHLVAALRSRDARYQGAGRIHHSEEAFYQDSFDDGFLALEFKIDALSDDRQRLVEYGSLSLQLSSLPLDLDPIYELCRTFGVQLEAGFRPQAEQALQRRFFEERLCATPIAFCVHKAPDNRLSSDWVNGIVVASPFYGEAGRHLLGEKSGLDPGLGSKLQESEFLVCALGSHHPLGQEHRYELVRCEWCWTSSGLLVRVVADWLDSADTSN